MADKRVRDRQAEAEFSDVTHKISSYVPNATTWQNPGDLLNALASTLPVESFQSLVLDHLCPVLDLLPPSQKTNICRILSELEVRQTTEVPKTTSEKIDYEGKRKLLEDTVKYLIGIGKREWHDGWEKQSELMGEIADELRQWLPVLWRVGVEAGFQTTETHRSLLLCKRIYRQAVNCNSRADWNEEEPVIIHGSRGNLVYTQTQNNIGTGIDWVFRDFLLAELASGKDVKSMLVDIRRSGGLDNMIQFLPANGDRDTETYHHGHWNQDMKAACDKLRKLLFDPHISEFENLPSVFTYRLLAGKSSSLAPSLLSITRQHIAKKPDESTMPYKVAAEIFIESNQAEDLLKLISELGRVDLRRLDEFRAYKFIARHLSTQTDQKLRAKSLKIVQRGVINVMQTLTSELIRAFPGLEKAYRWLEEMTNKGEVTSAANPKRDLVLSNRFVEKARDDWEAARSWEDETSPESVQNDVAEYEDEIARRRPNFAGCLQFWQDLLGRWGKEETEKLRVKFVREEFLFSVDHLAQALESECNGARAHLAAGIMAMKSFIEGGN